MMEEEYNIKYKDSVKKFLLHLHDEFGMTEDGLSKTYITLVGCLAVHIATTIKAERRRNDIIEQVKSFLKQYMLIEKEKNIDKT